MKYSVQCVILNNNGLVLGVSRKDNHDDFGLVGGKVDPEDEDCKYNNMIFESKFHTAMYRECLEETGIEIYMPSAQVVFQMHKDGFMGITYFIKSWSGEIKHDEEHVVEWVPFSELWQGSFGKWNRLVSLSLDNMGIPHIKYIREKKIWKVLPRINFSRIIT